MLRLTVKWALITVLFVIATTGKAASAEVRWSVSPMLGLNKPNLDIINDRVFPARLPVAGELLFLDGDRPPRVSYNVINPLPPIKYGTEAGLEFRLELTPRNHVVIGLSAWEGVSTAVVRTTLPFQGRLTDTLYERHASYSYLQYYIGWRRDLVKKHKKYNFYTRVLFNEVFDVDFRERFVFEFTDAGDGVTTFKRITQLESQATGHLMLTPGIGGEVFLREWLSFGMDLGYAIGLNKFELGNTQVNNDFQSQDTINISYPTDVIQDGRGKHGYLAGEDEEEGYKKMELDMSGWRAMFKVNIYY